MDVGNRLNELGLKGYCCSQIILQMGLDLKNKTNSDLIQAVSGLGMGLNEGLLCGSLTGGACLLSLLEPEKSKDFLINDLVNWFKKEYGELYGGIDCQDIIAGNPDNRKLRCPEIVASTYAKVIDLLEEHGCNLSE